jgi:hypothetical protein
LPEPPDSFADVSDDSFFVREVNLPDEGTVAESKIIIMFHGEDQQVSCVLVTTTGKKKGKW